MTNAARIEATPLTIDQANDADEQRVAEHLARLGVRVGAQRVELYRHHGGRLELAAWWGALGHGQDRTDVVGAVAADWFPWSLGHVRPLESLFVQNAGTLPLAPGGPRLGDLGYASVLHLPLFGEHSVLGAACAYWTDERLDWDQAARYQLVEWATSALERLPVPA